MVERKEIPFPLMGDGKPVPVEKLNLELTDEYLDQVCGDIQSNKAKLSNIILENVFLLMNGLPGKAFSISPENWDAIETTFGDLTEVDGLSPEIIEKIKVLNKIENLLEAPSLTTYEDLTSMLQKDVNFQFTEYRLEMKQEGDLFFAFMKK